MASNKAAGLRQLFLVMLLQFAFVQHVCMLQSGSSPFPWCVLVLTTEHVGHFFFDAAAEILRNEVDALLCEVSHFLHSSAASKFLLVMNLSFKRSMDHPAFFNSFGSCDPFLGDSTSPGK